MHVFSVLGLLVALVSAETIIITVGKDNGLTYDPPTVAAKNGDTIAFQFVSKNHTVTQSTFAKPCEPLASGVDSGYLPVAAGATSFPQWSFTLENDTAPLWFYCAQGRHCQGGMVFALNPTPERTFDAFKATAMGATPPAGGPGGSTSPTAGASGAVPSPPSISGSLTVAAGTGTATATNPSGTNASGNSPNPDSGAISTGLAGRSGLSGLMIVLGLSLFLI